MYNFFGGFAGHFVKLAAVLLCRVLGTQMLLNLSGQFVQVLHHHQPKPQFHISISGYANFMWLCLRRYYFLRMVTGNVYACKKINE